MHTQVGNKTGNGGRGRGGCSTFLHLKLVDIYEEIVVNLEGQEAGVMKTDLYSSVNVCSQFGQKASPVQFFFLLFRHALKAWF